MIFFFYSTTSECFCDGCRSGGIPLHRAKDVNFWYTAFVFKAGLMYMCQKQKENINSYRNFLRVLKKIIIRSRVFENWASVGSVCFDVPRLCRPCEIQICQIGFILKESKLHNRYSSSV